MPFGPLGTTQLTGEVLTACLACIGRPLPSPRAYRVTASTTEPDLLQLFRQTRRNVFAAVCAGLGDSGDILPTNHLLFLLSELARASAVRQHYRGSIVSILPFHPTAGVELRAVLVPCLHRGLVLMAWDTEYL